MKKTLAILAAFLLTAGAASAQSSDLVTASRGNRTGQGRGGNMTPEQRADMQTQRLTKELTLTADQSTKVRTIALAENQELQALRAKFSSADSRQGAGQEMKAIREKYDAQLKAVLTPEQVTKFDQMRDDQLDKRKDKMQGGMKKKARA
jgi:Spy/CpxP family protein refolding chaperone